MKRTVFAVALNHRAQTAHWQEAFGQPPYQAAPKTPVWFIKPRNTHRRDGDTISLPMEQTYSGGTLAVVMGRTARKVVAAEAGEYIAGYALANELSLAEESFYRPAIKAKCRDGFCPMGELAPLADASALEIITEVNGEERQRWSTADLHRDAATLIAALSDFATLQAGDVILLGTPQQRVPLSPGDEVTLRAAGLPSLTNRFTDRPEAARPAAEGHPTLFALGLNYADHATELDFKAPEEPLVFIKAPNTLTGDHAVSVRPDNLEYMHYEAELVVVIGKTARNVSRDQALEYVQGYTVCNDYAVRDYLENYYRPNLRVKSRDTLTPLLPQVTPRAAIPDAQNLQLKTFVNGELRQSGNTRDMVFDVPFLVSYLSEFMTLHPGDLIATGTPKGLADVRPGDEVVVEIEGIGRLTNHIVSEQQFEESLHEQD
ncbi:fumarylacetoacetate hydrolase family protein [Nissabacter sp. SGAir0207]|uniref:fumarylacetoacetate hydrolase family protein n=1 Tax=Nissabacter sp. SGAir0207 TaxID=2126321 RepID=UPI0010CCED0C|nr:fumarylacetoacetate hydrolase family protein [Nissabacter sp. SGAir0207]QCR38299.1 4-hydroxyphenylacetate degradation protein [Nissabacter sp. SGAir0207]